MADCLALLLQADFLTGMTCTWTNIIGLWFYVLMVFIVEIVLYIETENIYGPVSIGIFASIALINYMPKQIMEIIIGITAVTFAVILYKVIFRDE